MGPAVGHMNDVGQIAVFRIFGEMVVFNCQSQCFGEIPLLAQIGGQFGMIEPKQLALGLRGILPVLFAGFDEIVLFFCMYYSLVVIKTKYLIHNFRKVMIWDFLI